MSLLDTFTVLFEGDTRSVEQGAARSENAADKLLNKLKETDKVAEGAGQSFVGFASKALGALTAALGVGQVISSTIGRASDIHLMNQTSESIGVAVEEMDAFRRSVEDTGGTSQGAQDTVAKMAKAMGAALDDVNSSQAQAFAGLGISLQGVDGQSKDAMQGILEVAGAIEGMDKNQARFTIQSLGIRDSKTIELILKGRKEIENMTKAHKEQGVVSKEVAIQAGRLDDAMNKLRGGLDRAGLGLTDALLPAIIKGIEWLGKIVSWANEHQNLIVGFFGAIAVAVTAFYLPAMISAAAATLAATWPIIAAGAAIAAVAALFALAYDDVMNFIDGNDSLIGQVFEKYPMVKEVVFTIIDAFKMLGTAVTGIWDMIILGFQQVIDFIGKGVRQIANGISSVASFFGIGGAASDIPESNAMLPDDGQPASGATTIPALQGVSQGQQAVAAANASPFNSTTSHAISNAVSASKETNVQVGEVVVNTQATDAKGIAGDINGELGAQLKQLDAEYSSGVDR
jgi:hypothetical protein